MNTMMTFEQWSSFKASEGYGMYADVIRRIAFVQEQVDLVTKENYELSKRVEKLEVERNAKENN